MVKAAYLALAACLTLSACKFNERDYGDRSCSTDQDCPRPEQSCTDNVCIQRSCSADSDCGTGFQFSCISGACSATQCSGASDCMPGFACSASGFCQASFNVVSAASLSNTSLSVTFDAPPDPATAGDLGNYVVNGLTLSGTPVINGSTVTLATSAQTTTSYTITVSNVTRASDHTPLVASTATFTGRGSFNVTNASASSARSVLVTFDSPPDPASANTVANYAIDGGLTVTGIANVTGNSVLLTTSPQAVQTYTITVNGVTRASDGEALGTKSAMFMGRNDFNVLSATAKDTNTIVVMFDAPPESTSATTLANYQVVDSLGGTLALSGVPVLDSGMMTVTLTSANQGSGTYTLTVSGVVRANDSEALAVDSATFTGIPPFDVSGVIEVTSHEIEVTFDAPPDMMTATDPGNYSVPGLSLGTPSLSGNIVTIPTSDQSSQSYTLTVANGLTGVVRGIDGEPLTTNTGSFMGRIPFDLTNAASTSSQTVVLTFDGQPDPTPATMATNYNIPGLQVNTATLSSSTTVTLTTSPQSATTFTVAVSNVTRVDGEPLTVASQSFTGTPTFNVSSATGETPTTFALAFDAPPTSGAGATSATNIANYQLTCGTCSTTPTILGATLAGSTVTITTSTPVDTNTHSYTVTVTNVTRALDNEPLANNTTSFTGIPPFDVIAAASTGNTSVTVTFSAPPDAAALTATNYVIDNGLTVVSVANVTGNIATLTTSSQVANTSYTVTVSNVARGSDSEPLFANTATFTGKSGFNVISAASLGSTSISVTYDALPTTTGGTSGTNSATNLANYVVTCVTGCSGSLTLSGSPSLTGNTVTITTGSQAAATYLVTVSNVTRASDNSSLSNNTASFQHTTFNVQSAAALTSHSITVTFDAPPNSGQAVTPTNYVLSCTGGCTAPTILTTPAPTLSGNTVTLATTVQTGGKTYKVTVSNVTRASDATALTTTTASFTGVAPFDVSSATSGGSALVKVTFDAAPNTTQAMTLGNYVIRDASANVLAVSGTPVVSGSTVTLQTGAQKAVSYTVTVSNVARASDNEPLTANTATFTGTAQTASTVTGVAVQSTSPNVGTTFYNTSSAVVVITGTQFTGTACPSGVVVNDKDGNANVINTHPTSCTVDSDTQITATFPAGILSAYTGWDVRVTNTTGTASAVSSTDKLVVKAGLLVAAVSGPFDSNSAHQYFELYNPTPAAVSLSGITFHVRNGTTDLVMTLNSSGGSVASLHYYLVDSAQSDCTGTVKDVWCGHVDNSYTISSTSSPQLFSTGTLYLSLSATAQSRVIDKVGWGSESSPSGAEGTKLGSMQSSKVAERLPGNTGGAATDTDNNSSDFNTWSTTFHPLGNGDGAQP